MSDASITLSHAGLCFVGHKEGANSIGSWISSRFRRTRDSGEYAIDALRDIDLHVQSGERLGVIGLNGAGKTTLLKVMAGIYPVTSGTAKTQGHVCPMFEFATGFEMNQSGWDNIRIRGLLLGMSPAEINSRLHEIADFTELGEFLDYPVRTYSTGMFIRLAFAVSSSINPEVLLLDEIMGAGDLAFAEKAKLRMRRFMEQGKILVFTSHNTKLLSDFCERTIWLEKGRVMADGPSRKVIAAYELRHAPATQSA